MAVPTTSKHLNTGLPKISLAGHLITQAANPRLGGCVSDTDQGTARDKAGPSALSTTCSMSEYRHATTALSTYEPIVIIPDYEEKKQRLLKGKFGNLLRAYFDMESRKCDVGVYDDVKDDSDGYDTDLNTDLGLELIADEKTKWSKEDGIFPEYLKTCRKLQVNPNNYFLRNFVEEDFKMKYRYLSLEDAYALSKEMQNQAKRSLDLEDNGLGPVGMLGFAEMLMTNKDITDINLANNALGCFGARILKKVLVNNVHLVKVDISGNSIGDKGGKYIADMLERNVYVRELNLAKNAIGDSAAVYIGRALGTNITLELLDLSWNNIRGKGAHGVAKGLKVNDSLRLLNLSANGLNGDGGIEIFKVLRHNQTLQELVLNSTRINDKAVSVLAKVLRVNRGLRIVKLGQNCISADGAVTLMKGLKRAPESPLEMLNLDGVDPIDELHPFIEKIHSKRSITVCFNATPWKREKATDPLIACLQTLLNFLIQENISLETLFPNRKKEMKMMMSTETVIQRIEIFEPGVNSRRVTELRRKMEIVKKRLFELSELMDIYGQITSEKDRPTTSRLTTPFAGGNAQPKSQSSDATKHKRSKRSGQSVKFGSQVK